MSSQPDASLSTGSAQALSDPTTGANASATPPPPPGTISVTTTSRPDSQDTISHQQPPLPPPLSSTASSPPPPEVSLKQEESSSDHPPQKGGNDDDPTELYPVNALGDDEDLDTDTDSAATEEDELNHEQESHHRDASSTNGRGNHHGHVVKGTGSHQNNNNNEDAELSLSSDNDDDEDVATGHPNDDDYSNLPEETLCRWKDCGKVLPSIAALVVHLSDEHIGWKKTSYMCEWQGCSRRPIAQTTRFALISHMRSHTKHKPYDCPVPECDKSFSRSDAMAKHLKCQHGDVPERFTGRKSRGRYTMKDPAASSTLLHSSSFGAKKRRHHDGRSDAELSSSLKPAKMRKLGSGLSHNQQQEEDDPYGDRHHFHRTQSDARLLQQLNLSRKSGKSRSKSRSDHPRHPGQGQGQDEEGVANGYHDHDHPNHDEDHEEDVHQHDDRKDEEEYDEDAEDSDFAMENGQTPRERYGILKAKFQYIHNERESLESEYEETKKKLIRLRVERELLLDALLSSQDQYQDPALQDIEDSE